MWSTVLLTLFVPPLAIGACGGAGGASGRDGEPLVAQLQKVARVSRSVVPRLSVPVRYRSCADSLPEGFAIEVSGCGDGAPPPPEAVLEVAARAAAAMSGGGAAAVDAMHAALSPRNLRRVA